MTVPTNTFDSYGAVGNREDLQDKIYNVSPEEVPILSMGLKLKAEAKFHEWQRDTLAAPDKDNAVIEGDDRTGTALTATSRVGNYCQLFDKVAIIATTQKATKAAGRSDEMKYQIAKKTKELKRDVEAHMLSANPAVAGTTLVTARKSGGFGVQIYSNVSHGGAGATAAHTSGAPTTANTAGTNRTFTETLLKTVMQSIFTSSGTMPTVLALTPSHKATFSAFTGIAVNRLDLKKAGQAKIIGGADLYVSDFGNLTVLPNYIMATSDSDTAYVLNPDYYGIATLQPFSSVPLAKTGHTDKELISMELTCVVTSQTAQGKIDNLTP
jgi:hypothetical protein